MKPTTLLTTLALVIVTTAMPATADGPVIGAQLQACEDWPEQGTTVETVYCPAKGIANSGAYFLDNVTEDVLSLNVTVQQVLDDFDTLSDRIWACLDADPEECPTALLGDL